MRYSNRAVGTDSAFLTHIIARVSLECYIKLPQSKVVSVLIFKQIDIAHHHTFLAMHGSSKCTMASHDLSECSHGLSECTMASHDLSECTMASHDLSECHGLSECNIASHGVSKCTMVNWICTMEFPKILGGFIIHMYFDKTIYGQLMYTWIQWSNMQIGNGVGM